MSKGYTNLKSLYADLQKKIDKSLKEDVAPVVKEKMSEQVKEKVYDVYTPKQYKRRMDNGGLSSIENYNDELIEQGVLAVTNETPINYEYSDFDEISLTEQVITGTGYLYGNGTEPYAQPRDFMEATREELRNTNAHIDALAKGLKKVGLDIK